jgi:prolyl 4-hydroxylase
VAELLQKTIDFGVIQTAEGSEKQQTLTVIRDSIDYMQAEIHNLPKKVVDTCLNRHHLCAFWVTSGECDSNPAFMLTNCAPSCKTCHLIDMEARCPPLEDAKPALMPGQLNEMFENLVKTAPGNRTLPSAEREELEAKGWPAFTVHVLSQPNSSADDPLTRASDRKGPPWVVYFENFLTPEECQILIDLGHKEGYQRSKDVSSKQNFDGSFDGVESKGRTSENAWCSDRGGCRNESTVRDIHDRIGRVLGIDPNNAEDLQILRYEKGQFYNNHHDYIDHQRDRQCGPRILTFFLYLTDVEAGGGTHFDKLDITVTPKAGRALLWPSVFNSSPMDEDGRTTHEALPVEKGTKFAANAWIHQFDYLGPQSRGCN